MLMISCNSHGIVLLFEVTESAGTFITCISTFFPRIAPILVRLKLFANLISVH